VGNAIECMDQRRNYTGTISMKKYMYWIPASKFKAVVDAFKHLNIRLAGSKLTPCETLRMSENKAIYASPAVFNRMCVRQGSWYRDSERNGKYLLLSPVKLPDKFEFHLDAEINESSFVPDKLPTRSELIDIVESIEYNEKKPIQWEKKTILDAIMFKVFFTINRQWSWGENLKAYWLSHRANHANFVANKVTTEIDGEKVPYSVSENAGVCSSCVEFFNIVNKDQRKLVRACPGSITFGAAKKDIFLDVNPIRKSA
jgi:hypothetical protein